MHHNTWEVKHMGDHAIILMNHTPPHTAGYKVECKLGEKKKKRGCTDDAL